MPDAAQPGDGERFGTQRLVVPELSKGPVWIPSRAITVRQPWAYLMTALPPQFRISVLNVDPEWPWKVYRGPVWVYAAREVRREDWAEAVKRAAWMGIPHLMVPTPADLMAGESRTNPQWGAGLARGAVVGRFDITDQLAPTRAGKDWQAGSGRGLVTGLVTDRAWRIAPVACSGRGGVWRIPNTLAGQLAQAAELVDQKPDDGSIRRRKVTR